MLYKEPPQRVSLNTSEPTVPSVPKPSVREVFKGRDIWLVMGAGMCLVVIEFSAIAYFVLYLNEVLLFTVVTAGFFLAVLEAGGAFGKPMSGLISDRLFQGGRKKVVLLLSGLAFAMCLVFAFLPQGASQWVIVPVCLIFGFAAVGFGGLQLTLIGEFAGRELAGTVTGMSTVPIMAANMAGPPIFGYIVDSTGSYQIAWQFLAALAILATVLLLFVREEKKRI